MKKLLAILFALLASLCLFPAAMAAMPAEYVGEWEGSVGDINLSFSVNEDGTGIYTFEQSGYVENYGFTLAVDSETFTVDIPESNQLGIVACEGTYTYANDVLTLAVRTTLPSGRVFEYTVPCQRVLRNEEPTSNIPEAYIGKWGGTTGNISLVFEISADGRARFTFEQGSYSDTNDVALSVEDETFTVEIPEGDMLTKSCGGSYTYQDGVLTVSVQLVFLDGSEFSYTVPCERLDAAQLPLPEHEAVYAAFLKECEKSWDVDFDSLSNPTPIAGDDGTVEIVYEPLSGITFVISYAEGTLNSYSVNIDQSAGHGAIAASEMTTGLIRASGILEKPMARINAIQKLFASLTESDAPGVHTAENEVEGATMRLVMSSDFVTFSVLPAK